MNMNIYAVYSKPFNGTKSDQQVAQKNLELNGVYAVENIEVDYFKSRVFIEGFPRETFNSVLFDFIDGYGQSVDIYNIPSFRTYEEVLV
jgi:hypothetical protein